MRFFKIALLITGLIITSCSHETPELKELNEITTISKTSETSMPDVTNPIRVQVINDTYLMIVDTEPSGFLRFYRLPDLTLLFTAAPQGRGPNEFEDIYMMDFVARKDTLFAVRAGDGKTEVFHVSDTGLQHQRTIWLQYDGKNDPLNGTIALSDDLFLIENGYFEENYKEYLAIKPDVKEPVFWAGDFPDGVKTGAQKKHQFTSRAVSKPDKSGFFVFYNQHNRVKEFDLAGNMQRDITFMDPTVQDNSHKIWYMMTLSSTPTRIYVASANQPDDENGEPSQNTIIDVWDYDLNQLARYQLPEFYYLFDASDRHRSLYTLTLDDVPRLVRFDLK